MSNVQDDSTPHIKASALIYGQMQRVDLENSHHPLCLGDASTELDSNTIAQQQISHPHLIRATSDSPPSGRSEAPLPIPAAQMERINSHRLHDASTDARNVRRNMFLAAWNGFTLLAKTRKWILILRLLIGLAQLVVGIVILSLPSSMGDSGAAPDTCNPQGMFVFLTLHVIRVGFSIPVDFYLGLSPHRTPSARRIGSEGQSDRERNRTVGSLALDRKLSRFSDLLGLCHVVLFIVGNYTVWTNLECSHSASRSRPLWITCVSMLSVTYTIIVEVMLMIFVSAFVEGMQDQFTHPAFIGTQLLVFFLPLLIAVLRALGLALPQRAIRPETGKIEQDAIEKQSRLVYFTLAKDETSEARSSREDLERLDIKSLEQDISIEASREAHEMPLPLSRITSAQSMVPSQRTSLSRTTTAPRRRRLGVLFGFARKGREQMNDEKQGSTSSQHDDAKEESKTSKGKGREMPKYPIYPVPAHRATCPICLCDFEELSTTISKASSSSTTPKAGAEEESKNDDEVEPLRLLNCGHLMHKSCVDEWLTTVSGRCPVCQKPLALEAEAGTSGNHGQAVA